MSYFDDYCKLEKICYDTDYINGTMLPNHIKYEFKQIPVKKQRVVIKDTGHLMKLMADQINALISINEHYKDIISNLNIQVQRMDQNLEDINIQLFKTTYPNLDTVLGDTNIGHVHMATLEPYKLKIIYKYISDELSKLFDKKITITIDTAFGANLWIHDNRFPIQVKDSCLYKFVEDCKEKIQQQCQ